jgi:ABC-type Fe3+-siderophore transport system permease subunit
MGIIVMSSLWAFLAWTLIRTLFFGARMIPEELDKICVGGGDEARELVRFLRTAEVWAIIATGSALALAGAVIQLILAY